jgi:ornithine carbamoyltransferase
MAEQQFKKGSELPMSTANQLSQNQRLKGKDFLSLAEFSSLEIFHILQLALQLKNEQQRGVPHPILAGKTLAMIFEKSSTRTRVSFEVGMTQLGGHALYLNKNDIQMGRGESIKDTAKVLSGYVDGIMIRTFEQQVVEELALHATVPVVNGLTDLLHPCQVLADLLTVYETVGSFKGVNLTYIGDGNNMAHSLMIGAAKVGMDCTIATPEGYEPDPSVILQAQSLAKETGAFITVMNDPFAAAKGADFIYTDVWASMGWEEEQETRLKAFKDYQINQKLVQEASSEYSFLHCLPAHRGEEVATEIIDGGHSKVYQQAENRLHAQKALLASIM